MSSMFYCSYSVQERQSSVDGCRKRILGEPGNKGIGVGGVEIEEVIDSLRRPQKSGDRRLPTSPVRLWGYWT